MSCGKCQERLVLRSVIAETKRDVELEAKKRNCTRLWGIASNLFKVMVRFAIPIEPGPIQPTKGS